MDKPNSFVCERFQRFALEVYVITTTISSFRPEP